MKSISIIVLLLFYITTFPVTARKKTDINIIGHVLCKGEHIPFANVFIIGTTIGTATDITGHYSLINLPEGKHIIKAQAMGYKPQEIQIELIEGETKEIKFSLEEDVLGLEEVVITGDRNERNRRESSVIVSTISPKLFSSTQSVTLDEGLNFCPGLRMENNCQNCGFNQLRMNGLEGPYSQILINSRPIFSGLAGVYGMELIPANMIDRIEVVRGGGSALYGSNAIAGTVNLILKDPVSNSFEIGVNSGITGIGTSGDTENAFDYSVNFNTSLVMPDNKTGFSIYGFYRDRESYDANGDTFSELTEIKNTTLGSRFFHRFGYRSKIAVDLFTIKESRRGGDRFDLPEHEAGIAESLKHNITTTAISFDKFFRDNDKLSLFASGQGVKRNSYYGANKSLSDYGKTNDFTYSMGGQYTFNFELNSIIVGVESNGGWLSDKKLGYPDFENAIIENNTIVEIPHTDNVSVADQRTSSFGSFVQYEYKWDWIKTSLGFRFDRYSIIDNKMENRNNDVNGNVLSPRFNVLFDITKELQARVSLSQGYRAPQIYDEDLHIETSGSRKVIHINDPDLKQETSRSYNVSLDYKEEIVKGINLGFLVEGFYTQLDNPFVNDYNLPDEDGVVVYTRTNAEDGAVVKGVNMELNFIPSNKYFLKAGMTIQKSEYDKPQEFNKKQFFKSPDSYGFITMDYDFTKKLCFSVSGNYTGSMLVSYFGANALDSEVGELRESDQFFDLGIKMTYDIQLNGATIQVFGAVKNIFNSYQNDFDEGIDRDPGYVYGPGLPRSVYFGFKLGTF